MSGVDPTAGKLELVPAKVAVHGNIKQALFNALVTAGANTYHGNHLLEGFSTEGMIMVTIDDGDPQGCYLAKIDVTFGESVTSFMLGHRSGDDEVKLVKVLMDYHGVATPIQAYVLTDWEIDLDQDMYHLGSKFLELPAVQPV